MTPDRRLFLLALGSAAATSAACGAGNAAPTTGVGGAPGFVFLIDTDGAYLTDEDGAYLLQDA